MSFVVDGSEWKFDGWTAAEFEERMEAVLEFVANSQKLDQTIWIGEDFQTRQMYAEEDLWTMVTASGSLQLGTEVLQELVAWLGKAPCYLDEAEWPPHFGDITEIEVAGEIAGSNLDLAWAHHSMLAHIPVACLGISTSGKKETVSPAGTVVIDWVATEFGRLGFWRDAIVLTGDNEDSFIAGAAKAYPNLHFHTDVLDGLKNLAGGYLPLRSGVNASLATLNDHGKWIFSFPPPSLHPNDTMIPDVSGSPTNQIIRQRFQGFGLDAAPENPNVYADLGCSEPEKL